MFFAQICQLAIKILFCLFLLSFCGSININSYYNTSVGMKVICNLELPKNLKGFLRIRKRVNLNKYDHNQINQTKQ